MQRVALRIGVLSVAAAFLLYLCILLRLSVKNKLAALSRTQTRTEIIDNECGKLPDVFLSKELQLDTFRVNDKDRYMYCMIGKTASSTLRQYLWYASNQIAVGNGTAVTSPPIQVQRRLEHWRQHYSDTEWDYRMQNYYKFMFVREPLDKLVSAYWNKMYHAWESWSLRVVKTIKQKYRHGRNLSTPVTFPEFVTYILDEHNAGRNLDHHWQPQHLTCSPCSIKYNFIGHYETLEDDISQLIAELNMSSTITVPKLNPSKQNRNHEQLFSQLSQTNLRRLLQLYTPDYRLFQYEYPDYVVRHRFAQNNLSVSVT